MTYRRIEVIHVGPGYYGPGLSGRISIKPGERHTIIEFDSDAVESLQHQYAQNRIGKDKVRVFERDASNTGIRNGFVHRIHIDNVLRDRAETDNILREMRRIIHRNGKVNVLATILNDLLSIDEIEGLARQARFNGRRIVEPKYVTKYTEADWRNFVKAGGEKVRIPNEVENNSWLLELMPRLK